MAKIRKLGQSISTKDWMKYHPYDHFSSYDAYYLKLAKAVFDYLNDGKGAFRGVFQRDDLKEAAIIVTCHFEDFISQIGLWPALVRKHEELYGQPLPFYDSEDYDRDYLNPQDFAYLLWHQLGKLAQKTLDPYGAPLLAAADYCYDFFESRIDQAPATDFYESWLDLSSDTYFFELKNRLIWMAFHNYLLAPEFNRAMRGSIENFFEEETKITESMDPGKLIYGLREDYLLKKNSSFCALTVPEWLAEVARCPDDLRADIRRLNQRVQGIFLFEGNDEAHYHYQFVHSGRSFAIHRESFELDLSRMRAGAHVALFGIVNWQNEWWLSGTYMEWGQAGNDLDELRIDPQHANFYGWTEAQQQHIRDLTGDMEAAFIHYFGKRLTFFFDEKALAKAMQDHNAWWNEHRAKKRAPTASSSRYEQLYQRRSSGFDELNLGGGAVAAFFTPGEGVMISSLIPQVIEQLQRDALSEADSQQLFYTFFHEFELPLARYIAEHYPIHHLQFPLVPGADFVVQHFDFFLRYYHPGSFGETLPKLSLLPMEDDNIRF